MFLRLLRLALGKEHSTMLLHEQQGGPPFQTRDGYRHNFFDILLFYTSV
jgi:hypothetical protein